MKYEPITEDSYYHIYNCGNNKENIFIEEENYAYFLKLLKKHVLETTEILCYCLLKNHFHLLVKTKENIGNKVLSKSFSNLFNAYAKAINKKYNRSGSLFKDRFARIRVSNEDYLKSLIIYIHTNPVHHGFVDNFEDYSHSSYSALTSIKSTALSRKFVIELFDTVENFKWVHFSKQDTIEELKLE